MNLRKPQLKFQWIKSITPYTIQTHLIYSFTIQYKKKKHAHIENTITTHYTVYLKCKIFNETQTWNNLSKLQRVSWSKALELDHTCVFVSEAFYQYLLLLATSLSCFLSETT